MTDKEFKTGDKVTVKGKDYELIKKLTGGYAGGKVYTAKDKNTNQEVVIKILPKKLIDEVDIYDRTYKAVSDISGKLNKKLAVAKLISTEKKDDMGYIVCEKLDNSLDNIRKDGSKFDYKKCLGQVLETLKYLETEGRRHGDIADHNIMVRKNLGECALIDFGHAEKGHKHQDVSNMKKLLADYAQCGKIEGDNFGTIYQNALPCLGETEFCPAQH